MCSANLKPLSKQDFAIIEGCKKQDGSSQKKLYQQFAGRMMVICMRYASSTQEAEDILQEGFIRIFKYIKDFRGEALISTWMTRIMVNTALNAKRKKLYMLPMHDVENAGLHEAEEISLSSFHLSELLSMVQALPEGCRVIFNMYAIEGYTHKEIAEMLNISEGTSKSQYARARQLLQKSLNREAETLYGRGK